LQTIGQVISSFQTISSQFLQPPPTTFPPPPPDQQPPPTTFPPPPPDQQVQTTFISHENPGAGINISHPANWRPDDFENSVDFSTPTAKRDENGCVIDCVLVWNQGSTSLTPGELQGLANSYIQGLKERYSDLQQVSSTPVNIRDIPAYLIDFIHTHPTENVPVHRMEVILLAQGKLFSYALMADSNRFSTYLPVAQQMLNSLQLSAGAPYLEAAGEGIGFEEGTVDKELTFKDVR
jgi:hypothetical protein